MKRNSTPQQAHHACRTLFLPLEGHVLHQSTPGSHLFFPGIFSVSTAYVKPIITLGEKDKETRRKALDVRRALRRMVRPCAVLLEWELRAQNIVSASFYLYNASRFAMSCFLSAHRRHCFSPKALHQLLLFAVSTNWMVFPSLHTRQNRKRPNFETSWSCTYVP